MKKFLLLATMLLSFGLTEVNAAPAPAKADAVQQADSTKKVITVTADSLQVLSEDWRRVEMEKLYNETKRAEISHEKISQNQFVIIATILGLGIPFTAICVILFLIFKHNAKMKRMKYDLVEKAIEKGVDLPADFFKNLEEKPEEKKSKFKTPITLLAIGLAVSAFFLIQGNEDMALLTSLIWLMGLGYLMAAIYENKKANKEQAPTEEQSEE